MGWEETRKDERLTQSQRWGSKGRMQNSLPRAVFNLSHHMRQGNIRGFVRRSCHRGCCCSITAIYFKFFFLFRVMQQEHVSYKTRAGSNKNHHLAVFIDSLATATTQSVYVSVKYAFLNQSAWLHAASEKSCLR